jgi:hypothetical protein
MDTLFANLDNYISESKDCQNYGHTTLYFMNLLQENKLDPLNVLTEHNIKVKKVVLDFDKLYKLNGLNSPIPETSRTVYILNYQQIDFNKKSPIKKGHPINSECRSMIVTFLCDKWVLYSRAFIRFFDYVPKTDLTNYVLTTKEDGCIIQMVYDLDYKIWIPFTRGSDASTNVLDANTYGENVFNLLGSGIKNLNTNYTYLFELCVPGMQITTYNKKKLTLIGITDHSIMGPTISKYRQAFADIKSDNIDFPIIPIDKPLTPELLNELIAERKDPTFEGFVLWNPVTNDRIKYKSESFLRLFNIGSSGSVNLEKIAEVVLAGEGDSLTSHHDIVAKMDDIIIDIIITVKEIIRNTPDFGTKSGKKDFAISVSQHGYKSILFKLWNHKGEITNETIIKLIHLDMIIPS